jgi:hypothetical protein
MRKKKLVIYPVGTVVEKYSGKPFKSGKKTATIKEIVKNPYNPTDTAYSFEEDDSIVSAVMVTEKVN